MVATYSGRHAPLHRFANLQELIAKDVLNCLERVWSGGRAAIAEISQAVNSRTMSMADAREARRLAAQTLLEEAHFMLENVHFQETVWCLVHNRECNVCPRVPDERCGWKGLAVDDVWIEFGGNTCCPWSRMAACGRYASDAAAADKSHGDDDLGIRHQVLSARRVGRRECPRL